jgi:MYXO-CTERM domain-containing protein
MQFRLRLSGLTSHVANVALGLAITASVATSASLASAQTFPFPSSNAVAGNGRFTTTVLTSSEIQALYDRWKQNFIGTCPNNELRVVYPENVGPANDTRSEGVGYGMVIAAYMGDQTTFQGLRNYYFNHRDARGLMNWKYNDCTNLGNNGQGSAADADVDAVMGLIVANVQWPGLGFGGDATTLLGAIRGALLNNQCAGILLAGTTFADCGCINPSYIPVGYYPAFGAAEPAQAASVWTPARTNSYAYFANISNNTTGLVPAWSQASGALNINCNPEVSGGGSPSEYQADAARTPWRVATDYLWTGNASASTFLQDIADFAKTQRIVHIVDRYQLGGAPLPGANQGDGPLDPATLDATGRRSSFTMGGFASAMMASNQADLDAFTGAWQSMYLPGDNAGQNRAFGSSLAILYGLLVTGYMWDPVSTTDPTLRQPPPPTPPVDGNAVINGDFDEGLLGWSFVNISDPMTPGTPAEGFAMHLNGEMNVVIQRPAARAQDSFEIRLSQPVTLQAQQNYLISVKAKAGAVRPFTLNIEGAAGVVASLGNRRADAPLTIDTTLQTYDWVFTATAGGAFNLNIDVGNSDATVVLDDIVFAPTTLPPTVTGDLEGVLPPPGIPGDPTTPGTTPGTPVTPGGLGTVTPGGDNPGNPTGPQTGATVDGALPAAPGAPPGGNGVCTTDATCGAPFLCSTQLSLCYDPATGYVYDAARSRWSRPPQGPCDLDQVFLPTIGTCYVPETGYAYNIGNARWEFYGVDFVQGQEPAADGGCAVSGVPADRSASGWWLVGLVGAAFGLAYRRRS